MDLGYLVPSAEDTIETSRNSRGETPKECIRKGDVIYYVKPENINMNRKNNSIRKTDASETRPSLESDGHTDTINSGESLFKVFTFEQSPNDEDTEKCIAFWKSVMEKNLTPIKCTIIENTKNPSPSPEADQKEKSLDEKPSQASSEDVTGKIHEEYRKMWLSAIREIQKKKLHQVKLTAKARCKMCDSISSSVDEHVDKVDKQALKKEIKELNNWKSKSTKKQRQTPKETNSKTKMSSPNSLVNDPPLSKNQHSNTLMNVKQTSGVSMNKISDASTDLLEKTITVSSVTSIKEKIKKNLVPDTNTYIHKDVIGEKKRDGVYSKWRSKALEEVSQCRNSAEVAIAKKESYSSADVKDSLDSLESNEGVADQSKSQNAMDDRYWKQNYIQVDRNETKSTSALIDRKNVGNMKKMPHRKLSLLVKCTCSTSSCDCCPFQELLSRKIDSTDSYISKPSTTPSINRKNSLEFYRKSFSKNEMLPKKKGSFSSIEGRVPVNTVSSTENESTRKVSVRKLYEHESMTLTHPRKLGRSISLMFKHCRCSNEVCDCYKIEAIQREQRSNTTARDLDEFATPSRMVVKRVDSLEVTKKRFSVYLPSEKTASVQVLYPPSRFDDDDSL